MPNDLPIRKPNEPSDTSLTHQPRRYRPSDDEDRMYDEHDPRVTTIESSAIDRYGFAGGGGGGARRGGFSNSPSAGEFAVPAKTRWKRVRWICAAVRSSPWIAVCSFLVVGLAGLTATLGVIPSWKINAEIMIAANTPTSNDAANGSAADASTAQSLTTVQPDDVRALIDSPSLHRDVIARMSDQIAAWNTEQQKKRDALAKQVEDGQASIVDRLRPVAQHVVATVAGLPARVSSWFGGDQSSSESDQPGAAESHILRFSTLSSRTDSGQVVNIIVHAAGPEIAEACPANLLEALRSELTTSEHGRAKAELATLQPKLDAATGELAKASDAVTQYQLECGAQDPAQKATQLQVKLVDLGKEAADIKTQMEEGQAKRFELDRQLKKTDPEQISQEVITSNPHIAELEKEISDLQAQYNAELAVKQPAHPDMKKMQLEIESKKKDLNDERRQIISQMVKQPSPAYVALQDQQIKNDLDLTALAGRDSGLAQAQTDLMKQLADANKMSRHMSELTGLRDRVQTDWNALDSRCKLLNSVLHNDQLFRNISLVGVPKVADNRVPDEPRLLIWLSATGLSSLFAFFLIPCLIAMWRDRIVGIWQIETVGQRLPVQVAGHMPAISTRRLLGGATSGRSAL